MSCSYIFNFCFWINAAASSHMTVTGQFRSISWLSVCCDFMWKLCYVSGLIAFYQHDGLG